MLDVGKLTTAMRMSRPTTRMRTRKKTKTKSSQVHLPKLTKKLAAMSLKERKTNGVGGQGREQRYVSSAAFRGVLCANRPSGTNKATNQEADETQGKRAFFRVIDLYCP